MVEGLAKVIPVPLLSLFTGEELRTMVCGHPDIPLDMLKSVAVYKGMLICGGATVSVSQISSIF